MKTAVFASLLMLGLSLPGHAQSMTSETCSQHQTTYDAATGFCVFAERPNVFTTTGDQVLLDIRQAPGSQEYMVQAYDLVTEELLLAIILDANRQPVRFLLGDEAMATAHQEAIDVGLRLLATWQASTAEAL